MWGEIKLFFLNSTFCSFAATAQPDHAMLKLLPVRCPAPTQTREACPPPPANFPLRWCLSSERGTLPPTRDIDFLVLNYLSPSLLSFSLPLSLSFSLLSFSLYLSIYATLYSLSLKQNCKWVLLAFVKKKFEWKASSSGHGDCGAHAERDTDVKKKFYFFQLFHLSLLRIRKPEGLEECKWKEVMDLCKHALSMKEKGENGFDSKLMQAANKITQ